MATKNVEAKITELYKQLIIEGDEKVTVYGLCQRLGISEAEFYKHFSNLEAVGRKIWASYADETIENLKNSESYAQYGAREKLLAYFFTFFEVVLKDRTFIEKTYTRFGLLKDYQRKFRNYTAEVVQEGIIGEEIRSRHLENLYVDVLWGVHWGLVRFWLQDTSEGFVDTEKAIETYTKLPLELMAPNILDTAYEALRFTFSRLKMPKVRIVN
ncbi:MAG: hypothetical protein ACUVRD_01620 [Bacteroidia bacterium]